ncbi:hypothetical protein HBI05_020990 [Parastagonospora nodorum]|nr:hypothetical protein HBI05_020990 [Parastagonospora nodorum]
MLTVTPIKDNDNLLNTINLHIKLRKLKEKHLKVCKVDALKQVGANVREEGNKNCSSLYYSNKLEAQLRKVSEEEELAKTKKEKREKEKNKVVIIDPANSILCNLSNLLVVRFCIFSNSALENIGILINKEVVEMQTNTATALANKLAAVNKLFIIVCSFRKVDKHIFRAYNTISVTAQQMIIRKGSPYIEKRFNATNKRDSITSNYIYKIEDAHNIITNVKHNASKHKLSYKDILEKEGLNKLEASRRAAQFKIYSSYKVKRFTLNSIKDLFTNLSKNYFLSIVAEDAAKVANTLLLPKKVCAKILIRSYKLIVQAIIVALIVFAEVIILIKATHVIIIELQDSIVYFNLDSELELKVLSKQDVKITS